MSKIDRAIEELKRNDPGLSHTLTSHIAGDKSGFDIQVDNFGRSESPQYQITVYKNGAKVGTLLADVYGGKPEFRITSGSFFQSQQGKDTLDAWLVKARW